MPVETPSTWTWLGTTTAWADSANWSLTSGTGNVSNYPAAGDTADDAGGTNILTFTGTELDDNTINLSGGATIAFDNGSTLDGGSTLNGIAGTVAVSGLFTDLGEVQLASGDTLVVSLAAGATLLSDGVNGLDIGINDGGAGEFNGGTLYVLGGTLDNQEVHVNGGYAEVTAVLMNNDELSVDGGVLEIAQQSTVSPSALVFVNADTAVSSTLKFDTPSLFNGDGAGQVGNFETGDTIDIGANTIGTIVYNAGSGYGNLTVENTSGGTIFSTLLASGDAGSFQSGTFTVGASGGVAGSFLVTQGSGDTLISESGSSPPPPSGPVVTAGGNVSYTAGGSPATLDSGLTVTDSESSTLAGATIAITAGFLAGDTLTVGSPQSGIISNYDTATGTLTLSGPASLATYQTELDSVTYASSATDPTSAGSDDSRTIGWIANDGTTTGTADSSVSVAGTISSGTATDILFRDNTTGDAGYDAVPSGSSSGAWIDFGDASTAYSIVGVGNFNGGSTTEVLFRDNATGDSGVYTPPTSPGGEGTWVDIGDPSTAYTVVGDGDFTGNSQDDILFQDLSTGDMGYFSLTSGGPNTWQDLGSPSLLYSVVGVGDFNGDGTSDILMEDTSTGGLGYIAMPSGGGGPGTWAGIGSVSTGYTVVGIGNFTGGSVSDILFRDNATGDTGYYTPTGGGTWTDLGISSTAYSVVGVGDFAGNGISDILYRNSTTGDMGYSVPSGTGAGTWHDLGDPSTAYAVVSSPTFG